jgi:putative phosphoesterase
MPSTKRVAALYDIHGNLPALRAVLDDVRRARVDAIVIGGDVFPGPMPRETLGRLLDIDIPVHFIQGNGDRVVRAQMAGIEPLEVPEQFRELIRWNARQLESERKRLDSAWPATLTLEVEKLGRVFFCHATPRNDREIFTRLTPAERLEPILAPLGVPLVVCGHTHMQFQRKVGTVDVVNAGSVGMPYGEPGAYWLLLGPDVQLQRTTYDLAKAGDEIRRTSYPNAADTAKSLLEPPAADEMLRAFSKVELK